MPESYLRNSILATLTLYDNEDFPLTTFEVFNFLINPGRVSKLPGSGVGEIYLSSVIKILDSLKNAGVVGEKNGFYFLSGRDKLYKIRNERQKISAQKWKRLSRIARYFQLIPYVRAIWASGSLSLGNARNESDFDVMVVASHGRLYTVRALLLLVSSIFGARRKATDTVAPDKFCFNYYITDSNLHVAHQSIYTAYIYSHLKSIIDEGQVMSKFYAANIWMHKYILKGGSDGNDRTISLSVRFKAIKKIFERLGSSFFGEIFEKAIKRYQHYRIKKNPKTYQPGGRIVFTDHELEFHPSSFELDFIDKYNRNLKRLGIVPGEEEKDSGLTRDSTFSSAGSIR